MALTPRIFRRLALCFPAVVLVVAASPAEACRCAPRAIAELAADARIVFSGRVVSIRDEGSAIFASMEAERIWKGPLAGRVHVSTGTSTAECGVPFEEGARFVVFGMDSLPECEFPYRFVSTTTCDGTAPWSAELESGLDEHFGGVLWNAPGRAFRRGDVNEDGNFDLSDPVGALLHLFGGAPTSACLDAVDMNDSGDVDLSDAVFGLNFLFLGGPPLPAPGIVTPGFDGTTDDPFTCGDDAALDCETKSSSTLPGVHLDIVDGPCELTVDEAAAGAAFTYRVLAESPLESVEMQQLGSCQRVGPGGFLLLATITGGERDEQRYCLCDTGKCFSVSYTTDVEPGSGSDTLFWCGNNWFGPSDFNNPVGEPFPPGSYRLEVRARGTWIERGNETDFELSASYDFDLVAGE